jgi:hypothetical protein
MDVDDKSVHVGGLQRIKTPDGYIIPLSIVQGLPRLAIRPFTDREWDELPHVILTKDIEWDPSVLDHSTGSDDWQETISEITPGNSAFDEFGNYRKRVVVQQAEFLTRETNNIEEDNIDRCILHAHSSSSFFPRQTYASSLNAGADNPTSLPQVTSREITSNEPDYKALRPYFGWLSEDRIKKTLQLTTQYGRIPHGTLLKRHYRSPNPALNVRRRSEPVACDIVYSDTPAIDDGSTSAVLFVGLNTHVTDVYGIKTDRQFINTLEDNIRERGAPTKLISDRAQVEISEQVQEILRTLFISTWQSEPHQQQQNYAERRWQTVKTATN